MTDIAFLLSGDTEDEEWREDGCRRGLDILKCVDIAFSE